MKAIATPPSSGAIFVLLIKRELLAERRSLGWLASSLLLGVILVALIGMGFSNEANTLEKSALTVATLWLAFLFAGAVGVSRNFGGERQMGALEALLMLPVERYVIFLAKVLSGLVFLFITMAVMLVGAVVFAGLRMDASLAGLAGVMALAAIGYIAMATLISAMTSSMRGRDALLSICLFPLLVPLFLMAVAATRALALGDALALDSPEILLLIAIDAVYLVIGIFTFEWAIEA